MAESGTEDVMEGSVFDQLVRGAAGDSSRRALLTAAGAALGLVGLASLDKPEDAAATQGGRKRRRCKKHAVGRSCAVDNDCCAKKTKLVCGIPFGGGGGDPTTCCGTRGTLCQFPSDCCAGFTCNGGPTCVQDV